MGLFSGAAHVGGLYLWAACVVKVLCLFSYLTLERGAGVWHPDAIVVEVASSHEILDAFDHAIVVRRRMLRDTVRLTAYRTECGRPHF